MIIITTKKKLQQLVAEAVKEMIEADTKNNVQKGKVEFTSPIDLIELPSVIKIGETLIKFESLKNPNGDGGK